MMHKSFKFTLILGWLALNPAAADEANYKVGPGDVLQITVTAEPDFSGLFTVRSGNTIFYNYVKSVSVNDMTVQQIADHLTEILGKDYINNPNVSVAVKEYASRSVKILGAVNKPGAYTLKGETRILDVLTLAGGLAPNAGNLISVVRASEPTVVPPLAIPANEPIIVNYSAIVSEGKFDQNIFLETDDVINVPKGNEVMVLGQVTRPGPVPYKDNLTILQALGVAGGATPIASTKSTYILRKNEQGKSQKIKVRLDRIMEQKEENVSLLANDVIVIPESFF